MEIQIPIHRAKHNAKRRAKRRSRMQPGTTANGDTWTQDFSETKTKASDTMLDNQLSQKLKLLGNGHNNEKQAIQQFQHYLTGKHKSRLLWIVRLGTCSIEFSQLFIVPPLSIVYYLLSCLNLSLDVSVWYTCFLLFRERDSDKDGKVNFKEFFHGLFDFVRNYDEEGQNPPHEFDNSTEAPARKLFAELDKDGDRYLYDFFSFYKTWKLAYVIPSWLTFLFSLGCFVDLLDIFVTQFRVATCLVDTCQMQNCYQSLVNSIHQSVTTPSNRQITSYHRYSFNWRGLCSTCLEMKNNLCT